MWSLLERDRVRMSSTSLAVPTSSVTTRAPRVARKAGTPVQKVCFTERSFHCYTRTRQPLTEEGRRRSERKTGRSTTHWYCKKEWKNQVLGESGPAEARVASSRPNLDDEIAVEVAEGRAVAQCIRSVQRSTSCRREDLTSIRMINLNFYFYLN